MTPGPPVLVADQLLISGRYPITPELSPLSKVGIIIVLSGLSFSRNSCRNFSAQRSRIFRAATIKISAFGFSGPVKPATQPRHAIGLLAGGVDEGAAVRRFQSTATSPIAKCQRARDWRGTIEACRQCLIAFAPRWHVVRRRICALHEHHQGSAELANHHRVGA